MWLEMAVEPTDNKKSQVEESHALSLQGILLEIINKQENLHLYLTCQNIVTKPNSSKKG